MRTAFVASILWLASTSPIAQAAAQVNEDRVVYDTHGAVYSVPGDGGAPAQLTWCAPADRECAFARPIPSPDGRFVAFSGRAAGSDAVFVARADGSRRRRWWNSSASADLAWSPDSKRIAFSASYGDGVFVAGVNAPTARFAMRGSEPAWSADGRALAALVRQSGGGRYLLVKLGRKRRALARDVGDYAWSPKGRWLAVEAGRPRQAQVELMRADGSGRRLIFPGYASGLRWSPNGRFLALNGDGLQVVDIATGKVSTVASYPWTYRWAHRRNLLAFDSVNGVSTYDAAAGTTNVVTADRARALAWRLDDAALAYLVDRVAIWHTGFYYLGDVNVVTMDGNVGTLVAAAGPYGGNLRNLSWMRTREATTYRPASPRTAPATTSPTELVAPWPVTRLAADGRHVAYSTGCGNVFVWTPSTSSVAQTEPTASYSAPHPSACFLFDLAVAGDRVAWGIRTGNMSQAWAVFQQRIGSTTDFGPLATGGGTNGCTNGTAGMGDLAGAGDLLVFTRWQDTLALGNPCSARTTRQDVYRAERSPMSCPCPLIASSPGPLIPTDVEDGRIAAVGDLAALVLDRDGNQVARIDVHGTTAQLDGTRLLLGLAGQLREYDITTGVLVRTSVLPQVSVGRECANPHTLACATPQLILEDAARGLAAYVYEQRVHVLRLADGRDFVIAPGTLARFMDDGLVYVDGTRIHLTPWASLP